MKGVAAVKSSGRSLLELAGLCGLAVAQPVLAVFGDAPDWFVFRGATRSSIVAFALVVALVPPLVVWAVTQLAGIGSDTRRRVLHRVAVGGLVGLLALQVAAGAAWPFVLAVLAAVGAGVGAALAHARWSGVRLWTVLLSPAPAVFLGVFLFQSPVSGLVEGDGIDPAELGPFASGTPPPVVMIVFDEWPLASVVRQDGTIDADLYPNIAALAAGSTWYRDTTTVANLTNFAVPALLTGERPVEGDTADASTHPENLFTLLGGTYQLDVTERITRLCPTSLCATGGGGVDQEDPIELADLLAEAADVYADRLTPGEREAPVTDVFVEPDEAVDEAREDDGQMVLDDLLDRRPETLSRFLRGIRRGEPPTLHFLHLLAPHTPYRHLPDDHQYEADPVLRQITTEDDGGGGDVRSDAEPPALLDRQRLQLEVAHVDRLLGDVLDRLRRTGLYDEALLVVTSDHGIAFQPGEDVRGLGDGDIDPGAQPELLWVPLFVKAPGQEAGVISDEPAETIDVLPTIAAGLGLGLALPWEVEGITLDGVPEDRERTFSHMQGSSFATFTLDPPATLDADLADVFEHGVDTVLKGSGPDRWWRVGPRPDLLGRPPEGPVVEAAMDDLGRFLDVDLAAPEVPTVVSGRVASDVPRVAIVVNGLVAAVVDTYEDAEGDGRFAALVAPDLLVDGLNRIEAHRPVPAG